ncbi:hypothetical protein ACQKMD_15325 [Viridibacillus sp. NPDC096237]|uniref:hypothetical protein n=1 Tax=Viridibacillus sp. NPDC096237 TaxID=3390721 RepID=UPI003D05D038
MNLIKMIDSLKKFVLIGCCSMLLLGTFALSETSASAEIINENYSAYQYDQTLNELGLNKESDSYKLLLAVDKLPSDIEEQGAEKIAKWLSNETGINIIAENDNLVFPDYQEKAAGIENDSLVSIRSYSAYQIAACVGAVGVAVLSTAIPITKITKLKSIFKALGGVTDSISMIHMNYKYYRIEKKLSVNKSLDKAINDIVNKNKLGADAKNLLLDFFNLSLVAGSCGPLFE